MSLKRGFWEASNGTRWFVIGQDENGSWIGRRQWQPVCRVEAELFDRFLDGCDSWDWKPPVERKSLGERLVAAIKTQDAADWNNFELHGDVASRRRTNAAEAFLRDVLTPPDGKTLGDMFRAEIKCGEVGYEASAIRFLKELTGLDMGKVTP